MTGIKVIAVDDEQIVLEDLKREKQTPYRKIFLHDDNCFFCGTIYCILNYYPAKNRKIGHINGKIFPLWPLKIHYTI